MNANIASTISTKEKATALADAWFLKTTAAQLSYNNDEPEAVLKHRLLEIATRIETGFYNEH